MRGAAPRKMKIDDSSGLGTHKGYPYIGGVRVGATFMVARGGFFARRGYFQDRRPCGGRHPEG